MACVPLALLRFPGLPSVAFSELGAAPSHTDSRSTTITATRAGSTSSSTTASLRRSQTISGIPLPPSATISHTELVKRRRPIIEAPDDEPRSASPSPDAFEARASRSTSQSVTPTHTMSERGRDGSSVNEKIVDRNVPYPVREATAGVAVFSVVAGRLLRLGSPGAAGSAARFTSIIQLQLCAEVEDPSVVSLPWAPVFSESVFAQLAERAFAASVLCAVLTVVGAVLLGLGIGPVGLAQAAFIVPAAYVGPAVTGVAIQLTTLYAQSGQKSVVVPTAAETGIEIGFPTAGDAVASGAGAVLMWAHLAVVGWITLRSVPADSQHEDSARDEQDEQACGRKQRRLMAAVYDLLCGGLREQTPLRGCCGLSAMPMDDAAIGVTAEDAANTARGSSSRAPVKPTGRRVPVRKIRAVVFIELGIAHVFTLLAGIRGPEDLCRVRAYAALVAAAVFAFYVATSQPLASRLEHTFQLSASVLQLVAGGLIVAASVGNERTVTEASAAGEWAATAGLWLIMLQTVVIALVSIVSEESDRSDDDSAAAAASPLLVMPATPSTSAPGQPDAAGAVARSRARDSARVEIALDPQRVVPTGRRRAKHTQNNSDPAAVPDRVSNPLGNTW